MKISYSSFDTFNRCPLQYKFSYIDRIKTPDKPELFFGSLIHKIVQFALKKDPILPPESELLEILKNSWNEKVFASKEDSRQYFQFGQDMIKKFYAGHHAGLRNIVAVEKFFQIPLNEKHILSGVIDRVDKLPFGAFEVIDYKTSKSLPTQIAVDGDKQLATYNWAIGKLWPEAEDIRLTLYFLKFDSKLTTKRRPDEVEKIKKELIDTADKIEKATEFQPKDNPLCNWCSYQHLCPLKKHQVAPDKNAEEENIDELIQDYLAINQKITEIEPKIHNHFDKNKIERFFHKNGVITRTKNKKLSIRKN